MTINKVRTHSGDQDDCLQIHIATQPWEKREVYKLRYDVYVQEMSKPLGSIVNKGKQIHDSLDDRSILLYAQAGSNIVATMRLTIATIEDYPGDLLDIFHMHKFKALYTGIATPLLSLGTKLAVIAQYRNSPALFLLIAETYRILRQQKVQFFFGGCNPNMIPLYERIGFRRFTRNFTDPGYGLLVPLVVIMEDNQHFQNVKSPIYRHARKYMSDSTMAPRFLQAFPEAAEYLNTQLVTRKSLWEYVEYKLGNPLYMIPVFTHLDKDSIMDLLFTGAVFPCTLGDCIVYQGSRCNDLYILLSGALMAESEIGSRILHPGEHFGGLALPDQSRMTESVSALTDVEMIVISQQAFKRYQHLHQQASEILLNNLRNTVKISGDYSITIQGGQEDE